MKENVYSKKGGKMKETDNLKLAHEVIGQLRACGHFLYYRMGGRSGRRRILTILEQHQEILQKELQDILQIQSGSLSEVIIKLEADGLIKKYKSRIDGRQFILQLTDKGKEKARYLQEEYDEQVVEMMNCLSLEQMEELHKLLAVLYACWNEADLRQRHKNNEQ